jgi:hypothetical protein
MGLGGTQPVGTGLGGTQPVGTGLGGTQPVGTGLGGTQPVGTGPGGAAGKMVLTGTVGGSGAALPVVPRNALRGPRLIRGESLLMSPSGSAGAAVVVPGEVRVRAATRPTAPGDVLTGDPSVGPLAYSTTTGPWCCPHQSPTNMAPAPVAVANTHAPATDAADARALQVLTLGLPCPWRLPHRNAQERAGTMLRKFLTARD